MHFVPQHNESVLVLFQCNKRPVPSERKKMLERKILWPKYGILRTFSRYPSQGFFVRTGLPMFRHLQCVSLARFTTKHTPQTSTMPGPCRTVWQKCGKISLHSLATVCALCAYRNTLPAGITLQSHGQCHLGEYRQGYGMKRNEGNGQGHECRYKPKISVALPLFVHLV